MAYVKPTHAKLYRAVRLGRIFPPAIARFLAWAGALAALAFLGAWLVGVGAAASWHDAALAALVAYVGILYMLFFEHCLDRFSAPAPGEENLAEYLDYDALGIVAAHEGPLDALLLPLMGAPGADFVLARIGTTKRAFRDAVRAHVGAAPAAADDPLPAFLAACLEERAARQLPLELTWRELFAGLEIVSPFLKQYLTGAKLEPADLRTLLDWQAEVEGREAQARRFWSTENLMRTRGIGKSWAMGYAPHLERYAVEMNRYAGRGSYSPQLYGRQAETESIERILARDGKNNVILVGEPGIGKMITVSALGERIALGETLAPLAHKRVLRLATGALTAGADAGEIEARLGLVLDDAVRAGNIILVIDNIHDVLSGSRAIGAIDASEIFLPYLGSARLQIVGLTTYEGYHETVAAHAALARAFEEVEIREPAKADVYAIVRDAIGHIEAHDHVFILYQAVKAAVELSDRYIKNAPFPEKAIDLLQEAAVLANTKNATGVVTAAHIEAVVRERTQVPVGELAANERETLLNLESALHARVVGQDEAIEAIANAMRRARAGISSGKRPIGSFLFLGPTGVGKTETAKALAEVYFGSQKRMVRFDMSEYQQPDSIHRLIGRDEESGALTTAIMDHPFSLILLDEIEKAHPAILDVFLQVLDDGRLTDSLGRTADFTNAIIIATSNAGAELIREAVQQGAMDGLRERVLETLQEQGAFRPEFLNRFDAIVMFKPLDERQTNKIATLLLGDLNARLKEKGITVVAREDTLAKLVELGYDPEFGARPLRRVMQDRVENLVAKKLLSGDLKDGDTFVVTPDDLSDRQIVG
ncbi:MAG TPA: ATP-dependent Clp protease ATP-binding subunit [Candidatus Paceibacterota bacterium]|nr:ATP-dependent Clp protease ATP-binding subunit [Candidatus Paceibacterota bacterium]